MERRDRGATRRAEEKSEKQELDLDVVRNLVERSTRWQSTARLELMRLGSPLLDRSDYWAESIEITDAWRDLALRILQVSDADYTENVERQS
jgi:hypothetical protein